MTTRATRSAPTRMESWKRFRKHYAYFPAIEVGVDVSRMRFPAAFLARMDQPIRRALSAMRDLEAGVTANPDENRMVGHYWLRAPELAPTAEIAEEIRQRQARVKSFAAEVHVGRAAARDRRPLPRGARRSASAARRWGRSSWPTPWAAPDDPMRLHFIDNTDPDGIDRVLAGARTRLAGDPGAW